MANPDITTDNIVPKEMGHQNLRRFTHLNFVTKYLPRDIKGDDGLYE